MIAFQSPLGSQAVHSIHEVPLKTSVNADEIDVSVCLLDHLVAANQRSLQHCGSFDNEGSELYGTAYSIELEHLNRSFETRCSRFDFYVPFDAVPSFSLNASYTLVNLRFVLGWHNCCHSCLLVQMAPDDEVLIQITGSAAARTRRINVRHTRVKQ